MTLPPAIIHLIGYPASGKYTVAKALASVATEHELHVVLMDNHATGNLVLSVIAPGEVPDGTWDRVGEVREAVYRAIEELSPREWSFVFTNVLCAGDPADEATVGRLARLAAARGSRYLPIRVGCDVDVLLARVPSPGRAERHKWIDPDAVRAFVEAHSLVSADGHDPLDIDTTRRPPEDSADLILQHWRRRG